MHLGAAKHRSAAARLAVSPGRIVVDGEVLAAWRELASDGDFPVPADAVASLAGSVEPARALLLLGTIKDPLLVATGASAAAAAGDAARGT